MARLPLAAVTSCLADRGAEEAVRAVARLGFEGVEFLSSATLLPQDAPPDRRRSLRAVCRDLGLGVVGLNGALPAAGYRLLVDDERERHAGVEQGYRVIDLCADLGGSLVTVGSPGARNVPEGMARSAWWPRALDAFRAWADHAAPSGVRVALEIINRFEGNWGRTIAEGLEFLAAAGHPNLGLTIDTFHMNIDEGPFAEAIAAGGRHILHVHVADSNRQAPGDGNLDFRAVLGALHVAGYQGYLSLELFPEWHGIPLALPPEESLRRGQRFLRRLLEQPEG